MMMQKISKSKNIALYPSLSPYGDDGLACAWYEYSSPKRAAESDIWFSKSENSSTWTEPVCISGNVSYNNGPSLVNLTGGGFLVAWHSWREPGKAPFTADGGIANIWMSYSKDGELWNPPFQPFPDIVGSKYPSLVQDQTGSVRIVFTETATEILKISSSEDGLKWQKPFPISGNIGKCGNPDIALDCNNVFHMVFMRDENSFKKVKYFTSSNLEDWVDRQVVFSNSELFSRLARPKISIAKKHQPHITLHSNGWGSFTNQYDIKISKPTLSLRFEADHMTGRDFWVLNSVLIKSYQSSQEMFINFGVKSNMHDMISVQGDLFDNMEYKFNGDVECMKRELGTENTRSLVCSDQAVSFELSSLKPGNYFIEVTYSSWLASNPGFNMTLDAEILKSQIAESEADQCLWVAFDEKRPSGELKVFAAEDGFDQNRPSKIVERSDKAKYVAWTSFNEDGIDIVMDNINKI